MSGQVKSIKPANQLIMFSNQREPEIATWFSGSPIFEYDMKLSDLKAIPELNHLYWLVNYFEGSEYTKVTVVMNYKASGIFLAKASGSYPLIYKIDKASDYDDLDLLFKACDAHSSRKDMLSAICGYTDNLIKALSTASLNQSNQHLKMSS